MTNKKVTLSQADVTKLMRDPSANARGETAEKIACHFQESAADMTETERQLAEDIFRVFAKDAEVLVREAMAKHLKAAADLPRDVALTLAADVDSVSLPMIKFSEVLTDEDLIAIVKDDSRSKQVAVAQRDVVSGQVADALIDSGNETAVARLVANEGAELREHHYDRVMTDYKASEPVSDSLARRPSLPPKISEQLVNALSQKLEDYLVKKHELSPGMASNLVLQTRERVTASLTESGSSADELEQLVEQLHVNGRLTGSLILRSLCVGDMAFFEAALSRLAKVPLGNARILIHDQGPLGMESIYDRSNLDKRLFPAFRAAVLLLRETEYDGGAQDRERFVQRVIERLLTQFDEPGSEIDPEEVDFLMTKLENIAA